MPGTASSPLHSRTSAKARPSAATRAANLIANTPVLFRLPAIQHLSAQAGQSAVVASEAGESTERSAPTATIQPQISEAVVSPAVVTMPAVVTHPGSQRSWWEHWSSGIVLIVLLIALATASILVLRGSGEPKYIADVDKTQSVSSNSLSTLSNIEVPDIRLPEQTAHTAHDQPANSLTSKTTIPEALPAATPNPVDTFSQTAQAKQDSLIPAESLVLTFETQANLSKPARTFLGVDISKFHVSASSPSIGFPSEESPTINATASLDTPIGVQPPRLFGESNLAPRTINVQATPASTNTNSPNSGTSPSFYDNSSTLVAKPSSSEFSGILGGSDLPLQQKGTYSVPATTVSSDLSSAAPTLLISEQETTTAQAPAVPIVRSTSTPEFNREQLLKAYQEFTRVPVAGQNRYQQSTSVSAPMLPSETNAQQPSSTFR